MLNLTVLSALKGVTKPNFSLKGAFFNGFSILKGVTKPNFSLKGAKFNGFLGFLL